MQKISTEKIGEKVIVLLQEDVDASDQRLTRSFQSPRQASQVIRVWIDCASLSCIKTYGFCHFLNQLLVLKTYGVTITLFNLSVQQKHLMHVLRLDSLFAVVPDVEEAYQLVQAS